MNPQLQPRLKHAIEVPFGVRLSRNTFSVLTKKERQLELVDAVN